ncbi:MAG: hypothetical protein IJF58_05325 [Clostridia bacterium]|nr:hypothetical protein [Clostridia bacterium]MBQ2964072.1 hypothetical protein [Clostridia bacterium]
MYCLKCGQQIEDTAMNCPYCGCATENAGVDSLDFVSEENAKSAHTLSMVSIVLGGVGIIIAWLFALFGYIFGGVALAIAFAAKGKNANEKKVDIAIIISALTLGCSVLNSIIGMSMMSALI